MSRHWKYGGSTAQRTMNCAAWVGLAEKVTKAYPVSAAAEQGTVLHEALECRFTGEPERLQAWAARLEVEPDAMRDLIDEKVTPAIDRIEELFEKYKVSSYDVEVEMESPVHPEEIGGTADILAAGSAVLCLDYKSGDGLYVDEEHGFDQLMFYAWLAWLNLDWADDFFNTKLVVIGVVQPYRGKVLSWTREVTLDELQEWGERFIEQYKDSIEGNPKPNPGDWCRFCPASPTCPAKLALVEKVKHLPLETRTQLGAALDAAEELDAWIKDVRTLATSQLEAGAAVPGYKLVAKRGQRRWSEDEPVKALLDANDLDGWDIKLKSPAQLEKVCKKAGVDFENFSDYITNHSTGTTLTHESDPRPAVLPIAHLELVAKTTKR